MKAIIYVRRNKEIKVKFWTRARVWKWFSIQDVLIKLIIILVFLFILMTSQYQNGHT